MSSNGEKTFITSGMRADYYTVAVRTGGPGASGVSLLLIERDRPGFTRTPLKKMGWWCSDTATLHFDDVRVPAGNLIGEENAGFRVDHAQLQLRAARHGGGRGRLRAGLPRRGARMGARAQDLRPAPGRATRRSRHKLVEMQTRVHAARALLYDTAWKLDAGAARAGAHRPAGDD